MYMYVVYLFMKISFKHRVARGFKSGLYPAHTHSVRCTAVAENGVSVTNEPTTHLRFRIDMLPQPRGGDGCKGGPTFHRARVCVPLPDTHTVCTAGCIAVVENDPHHTPPKNHFVEGGGGRLTI